MRRSSGNGAAGKTTGCSPKQGKLQDIGMLGSYTWGSSKPPVTNFVCWEIDSLEEFLGLCTSPAAATDDSEEGHERQSWRHEIQDQPVL